MFINCETGLSSSMRLMYKIIDSDFIETGETGPSDAYLFEAIIDTYEKRNLNVATNLVKAFIWYSDEYNEKISDIIEWIKEANLKFAKYEKDINKYLMLM